MLRRAVAVACIALAPLSTGTPAAIDAGRFSALKPGDDVSTGWRPLTFRRIDRHTVYSIVEDDGRSVLRAEANGSASGLARPIDVDLREHPVIEWRWKVANLLDRADATRKAGDDYAARIYVAFRQAPEEMSLAERARHAIARLVYGDDLPHAGISYVWDSRLAPGTILPNPYTDRVRMIVVRSGPAELGRWLTERRNVYDDYRRAFGSAPPPVAGVAVMTDADDTGGRAVAWYGDIRFLASADEGR